MMPKASGKIAPPSPCTARAAIITPSDEVNAAASVPAQTAPSVHSRMRRRPYMSPRRPASGVATAAESRNAVKTHAAPVCVVCSRSWIVGSAGTTSDCTSA